MKKQQSLRKIAIADKLIHDIVKKEEAHLQKYGQIRMPRNTVHTEYFRKSTYVHKNLFSILTHPDMLEKAYYIIRPNKGANTPGIDTTKELDGFSVKRIKKITEQLKNETYEFSPIRRKWIPKPGKSQKRPLGIPSPQDKTIHTSMLLILQAIYEPEFALRDWNYGFRPKKYPHLALEQIKTLGKGMTHVIEGDIKGAYDNVDHNILLRLISRRTTDKKFLRLLRKILKTGIMDNNKLLPNEQGVPQGSTLSPLLWNIYMYEFDIYVNNDIQTIVQKYRKHLELKELPIDYHESQRKYRQLEYQGRRIRSKQKETLVSTENKRPRKKELKRIQSEMMTLPATRRPPEWNCKMLYVRYADDWILAITGPPILTQYIKNKCTAFLKDILSLDLSQEKTKITDPSKDAFIFLGHNIYQRPSRRKKKVKTGRGNVTRRTTYRDFSFRIPFEERILPRLHTKNICTENGFPREIPPLTIYDDASIALWYKQQIYGYMNYFSLLCPKSDIQRIHYIFLYSCYKTLAHKHKTTVRKIRKKYETDEWALSLGTPVKYRQIAIFHYRDYKMPTIPPQTPKTEFIILRKRTKHHLYSPCSICNGTTKVEMHHIQKHKKGNKILTWEEQKKLIQARQIPLCRSCHIQVHNGTIKLNQ